MRSSLDLILAKCEEDPETLCLVWKGYTDPRYGRVRRGGKLRLVHREAYERTFGPIPWDMQVHHLCHNKLCANVDHMVLMSQADHPRLHRLKEPLALCCGRGHEYTAENTYIRPDGKGRMCKACQRLKYQAARLAA